MGNPQPPDEAFYAMLDRVEIRKRRYARFTVLLVALTLLAVVISGWVQRQQIIGCTQPGGACYEANAKRSEAAINFLDANHDETVQELHELQRLVREIRQEIRNGQAQGK